MALIGTQFTMPAAGFADPHRTNPSAAPEHVVIGVVGAYQPSFSTGLLAHTGKSSWIQDAHAAGYFRRRRVPGLPQVRSGVVRLPWLSGWDQQWIM
ncbi:hypothetical protein ACFWPH_33850 [Nocardia sp. NPDC058499]|uniref:hypothetical protein n=1 Tax=Nocardia sp. NPDC058499 TaxID=3346530 RepID=UPI003649C20C